MAPETVDIPKAQPIDTQPLTPPDSPPGPKPAAMTEEEKRLDRLLYGKEIPGEDLTPPKPEEPPKPAAEAEKPADKPADKRAATEKPKAPWDTTRQRRDQETANERKAREALQKQIDAVTATVAKLVETNERQAATIAQAKRQTMLDKAKAKIESLDEDSGGEAVRDVLNEVMSLVERGAPAKEPDENPTVAKLTKTVEALQKQIADLTAEKPEDTASEEQAEWDDFMDRMDHDYGAEHAAKALENAKEYFKAKGYTDDKPPDADAGMNRVELEFAKLASAAGGKKAKGKAGVPDTALDVGTGGAGALTLSTGSVDEIADVMLKEGKFAGAKPSWG